MDIIFSSTTQLAAAIRAREISAVEVLEAHLAQIEKHNAAVNAVVILDTDKARERARDADQALARGESWGALHGVPFTIKDAHATKDMRSTVGFPPFDHVPPEDSTTVARLKAAGAILMGKTNVAAMLGDPAQTDNPIFGRTNNPYSVERTSGGSSGGAAAAVAAGMTPFDVGTDLSGSTRIPAHFCGVFGLKPTENRVPLTGLLPGITTPRSVRLMSCIGPMARTIDDVALLYSILAGPDGRDMEVQPVPVEPLPEIDVTKLRIGVITDFQGMPVSKEIRSAVDEFAQKLKQLNIVVEQATLPASDLDQDLENAGELIGMIVGAFQPDDAPPSLDQYFEVLHKRDQAMIAWEQFFDQWDVLLCPPAMTNAFPHTESGAPLQVDGQEQIYWMISAHTTLFNYTGHPAIVIPYKLDHEGLPIGVQLVGKRWGEARLLAIAKAITAITGGFQRPEGY